MAYIATFIASDREDWTETLSLVDTNGNAINLVSATIVLAVNDKTDNQRLLASTTNGKIIVPIINGNNQFTWTFDSSEIRNLLPDVYTIGLTIDISGVTQQLLTGTVEIYDGVVP